MIWLGITRHRTLGNGKKSGISYIRAVGLSPAHIRYTQDQTAV